MLELRWLISSRAGRQHRKENKDMLFRNPIHKHSFEHRYSILENDVHVNRLGLRGLVDYEAGAAGVCIG